MKNLLLFFDKKIQTIRLFLFRCQNLFTSLYHFDRVGPILFLSNFFTLAQNSLIPLYSFCQLLLSFRYNVFEHFILV